MSPLFDIQMSFVQHGFFILNFGLRRLLTVGQFDLHQIPHKAMDPGVTMLQYSVLLGPILSFFVQT